MTGLPERFDTVHLFLDETGQLRNGQAQELRAVGGLICLGPWDADLAQGLGELLQEEVEAAQGQFPADLHLGASRLTGSLRERFLERVRWRLERWQHDHPQSQLLGVHIAHGDDLHDAQGLWLLDERAGDNRYLHMLYALLEHLSFVSPALHARLAPHWQLHVHVARRTVRLGPHEATEAERLTRLGFEVEVAMRGEEPWGFVVRGTLEPAALHQNFALSLRQRWSGRTLELGTLEVCPIRYDRWEPDSGVTQVGLYLADMYLGQRRARERDPELALLLPPLAELTYEGALDTIAELRRAVDRQNLPDFLEHHAQWQKLDPEGRYGELVAPFAQAMYPAMRRNPEVLARELLQAARQIDTPGQSELGFERLQATMGWAQAAGVVNAEIRLIHLKACQSHANHSGLVEWGDELWMEYQASLNETLQPELWEHHCEIARRRAVNLTDQWRHEEAREALIPDIVREEDFTQDTFRYKGMNMPIKPVARRTLGAFYGALGQVEAFTLHLEMAESFCRQALAHFHDEDDRQRQWIYLGHLALERIWRSDFDPAHQHQSRERGLALWQETLVHLPCLASVQESLATGSGYVVALCLKGLVVAGTKEALRGELAAWEGLDGFARLGDAAFRHHPTGLIMQTLGMGHARLALGGADEHAAPARRDLLRAAEHMDRAPGQLLRLLGLGARLRAELLAHRLVPDDGEAFKGLHEATEAFLSSLKRHFFPGAWHQEADGRLAGFFGSIDPGPDAPLAARAEALLGGLRFNYW